MPNTSAPTAIRAQAPTLRDKWESELWDDLPLTVYNEAPDDAVDVVVAGTTLVVCSFSLSTYVPSRLQVTAQAMAYLTAGASVWSAQVRLDTVNSIWSEVQRWPAGFSSTLTWNGTIDVNPGTYTLDIELSVDALGTDIEFYQKRLIVRRGRRIVT